MATITLGAGTKSSTGLTAGNINSLASATYVSLGTIDVSAIDPLQLVVELGGTCGAVTGTSNYLYVFAKASFDNTVFTTGPESGTTTTDEQDLYFIGSIPMNTASTLHTKSFDIGSAIGFIPPYVKIIVKNSTGVAIGASGGIASFTTYTGTSV